MRKLGAKNTVDGINPLQIGSCYFQARNTQYNCYKKAIRALPWCRTRNAISHLHDQVCGANNEKGGRIIAVDLSPGCLRDLVHLAKLRPGLVPVLGDARKHSAWGVMVASKVDWLLQDVSQAGQAEIFVKAVKRFLKPGGKGLLSLKAASERFSEGGEREVFRQVREQLEDAGLTIEEQIDLHGLEDNHCLYFVTN